MHSRRGVRWSGFDRAFCRNVLAVRPKNAPAPRKILSSRPDSGIPSLRSRNSRIGQGGKTAFIFLCFKVCGYQSVFVSLADNRKLGAREVAGLVKEVTYDLRFDYSE